MKTPKKQNSKTKNTIKNNLKKINGKIISKREGWKVIEIFGNAYDRGYAHGVLFYKELHNTKDIVNFIVNEELKETITNYIDVSNKLLYPIVKKKYPEIYEEIKGISHGAKSKGVDISIEFLISYNGLMSLYSYFLDSNPNRCSAFIATGDYTIDGKIIMAHNTHVDYATGKLSNAIIYVTPDKGIPFVMQTSPGCIASNTSWFICKNGLIGCETTIGEINYKPIFGSPYFCRIRQCMQYGNNIEEYISIMQDNNAGDYACSWLFGDINNNLITRFELGLNISSITTTNNGVYYGMNSAFDPLLREVETTDNDIYNIETSSGSRNKRFYYLLNNKYYGKIDIDVSKKILSDHYDCVLDKNKLGNRNICKHCELSDNNEKRTPYYPYGCFDGKVVNYNMIKNMSFYGRFGSSCGRIFNVKEYLKKNPEYLHWKKYLSDIPKYDWIKIEK